MPFVCIMLLSFFLLFLPLIFANSFCLHACHGLLTHSLFISCIILHHALNLLVFPNYMFSPFFL